MLAPNRSRTKMTVLTSPLYLGTTNEIDIWWSPVRARTCYRWPAQGQRTQLRSWPRGCSSSCISHVKINTRKAQRFKPTGIYQCIQDARGNLPWKSRHKTSLCVNHQHRVFSDDINSGGLPNGPRTSYDSIAAQMWRNTRICTMIHQENIWGWFHSLTTPSVCRRSSLPTVQSFGIEYVFQTSPINEAIGTRICQVQYIANRSMKTYYKSCRD